MSISVETLVLAKQYTQDYVDDHPSGGDILPANQGSVQIPNAWSGSGPYRAAASVVGYTVTARTQVNLYADDDLIDMLREAGVQSLYCENDNGFITAVAIGGKPSTAISVDATFMEVKE